VDPEPSRLKASISFIVLCVGTVAGAVLVVSRIVAEDPPGLWWVGIVLLVVFGIPATIAIRLALLPAERRAAHVAKMRERNAATQLTADRLKTARAATKHHRGVLRTGVDGTAVVLFLADAGAGEEHRHLVYLELRVAVDGVPPYDVRSGEYLTAASTGSVAPGRELVVKVDPADPSRVAVDWERSLRLR
jgi:hypothetical protein